MKWRPGKVGPLLGPECAAAEPVLVPGHLSRQGAILRPGCHYIPKMLLSSPHHTGSSQERKVFEKAMGKLKPNSSISSTSEGNTENEEREPSISGVFKVTGILTVGKDVNLALILKNLTSDMKTVTVNMTAWTIVYNGTLVHEVWKDSVTLSLDPEEGN